MVINSHSYVYKYSIIVITWKHNRLYLFDMKMLSILNELLLAMRDIDGLTHMGEEMVDSFEYGPYKVILLKNKSGRYQLGLASYDNDFTDFNSHLKHIPSKEKMETIIPFWSNLSLKIAEWLELYNPITAGSTNPKKTRIYHSIFSRAGLNCGEIRDMSGGTGFIIEK